MARKKQHAVLVASLANAEESERARKAKTMIAHTGFEYVRIVDVSRIHSGFAVIDNDEIVERCFGLFDPDHPNVRLINADIQFLNPAEIDRAASMPGVGAMNMATSSERMRGDDEMEPLRQRYTVIAGRSPDRRWAKDRLLKEIEAAQSVAGVSLE